MCKTKPIGPAPPGAGGNGQDRRRNWLRFRMPIPRMVFSKSFHVQGLRSFQSAENWVRFARPSHLKRDTSHLMLPTIGFVSHKPPGRIVSWAALPCPTCAERRAADGGRFSRDSSRREDLYLAQSRRDAELVVNRISPFSAQPPRLVASQFRLRPATSLGPSFSATQSASPSVPRIDDPGRRIHSM